MRSSQRSLRDLWRWRAASRNCAFGHWISSFELGSIRLSRPYDSMGTLSECERTDECFLHLDPSNIATNEMPERRSRICQPMDWNVVCNYGALTERVCRRPVIDQYAPSSRSGLECWCVCLSLSVFLGKKGRERIDDAMKGNDCSRGKQLLQISPSPTLTASLLHLRCGRQCLLSYWTRLVRALLEPLLV